MTEIFIIFMLAIIILAIIITVAAGVSHRKKKVSDEQYIDSNGDHMYYDRSSIEKCQFAENNPDVKDVRTFRRLFKGK